MPSAISKKKLMYRESKGTFFAVQWMRTHISNNAGLSLRKSMKEIALHPIVVERPTHKYAKENDYDISDSIVQKKQNPVIKKMKVHEGV